MAPHAAEIDMRIFTCELCEQTFTSAWSEEEALAEMRAKFGEIRAHERAALCTRCARLMDESLARGTPPSVVMVVWRRTWLDKPGIKLMQVRLEGTAPDPPDESDEVVTAVLSFRCTYPENIDKASALAFDAIGFNSWPIAFACQGAPKANT